MLKLEDQTYPVFLGSEIEQAPPQSALFHVLSVPYEKTVSYGAGTALGPSAILKASWQLEMWEGKSRPCDEGIHTCEPIDCSAQPEQVMENIAMATKNILDHGAMPVVLGGEHSITYGVLKGLKLAGYDDFGIIQIDAHADLRDCYEGNYYSHASVMKRAVDLGIPLYQLGVRAYCEEEIEARKIFAVHYQDAEELVENNIQSITLPDDFPSKIYLSVDIDGLDATIFPATGTPVPGGLGWYQTLNLFESIVKQRELIGFDLVELAPIAGFPAYDFAASVLIYKMMGILQRNRI